MAGKNKAILQATVQVMEQLLEFDNAYDVISNCIDIIGSMMQCDAVAAWIVDEEGERLHPLFHKGPSDITGVSISVQSGAVGKAVTTGETVFINDTARDPEFEGTVFDGHGFSAGSVLCVPLNLHGKVHGCFEVIQRESDSITEDEITICKRIAGVATLAISESGLQFKPAQRGKTIITLRNIIKEYPTGGATVRILNGIDLDIYDNEFVVILGESGCGKSTLLNIIGGMDELTEGEFCVEGTNYSFPTEKMLTNYRRNYVGFIFQSYNLMPNLTAKENLEFIADLVPSPMDAEKALEKVGMLTKKDNYPSQLSGGQQQRIAIARALIKHPKLILADEPTAALDLKTSLDVLDAIESIVRDQTASVVMVTHNVEIAKMADRVIRLRAGRVASIKANPDPLHAYDLAW